MKLKVWQTTLILILTLGAMMICYLLSYEQRKEEVDQESIVEALMTLDRFGGQELNQIEHLLASCDELIRDKMKEAVVKGEATEEEVEKRMLHMKRVTDLVLQLTKELEQDLDIQMSLEDIEVLTIASYLHDICKYEGKNHAKKGAIYVKEHLEEWGALDQEKREQVARLIYYHSHSLSVEEELEVREDILLIHLLQDADAADKIIYQNKNRAKHYQSLNLSSSKHYIENISKN